MTKRALLIVLDSVGVGSAPDAGRYGDDGANTLGHILARCPELTLPTLTALGLPQIMSSDDTANTDTNPPTALVGRMREFSTGKDTTTGHWELGGVHLQQPFATFESFPRELIAAIEADADVQFIGNYPQSGTLILDELGAEHLASRRPILYTSADSVLQIAAHEEIFSTHALYRLCEIARRHCDSYRIGRVIARPFTGAIGNFQRTAQRRDFSMQPPPTVLNALTNAQIPVTGIGKISDIFASSGISHSHPTHSNAEGMATIDQLWPTAQGLLFANLVDFDMLFGHRRDVAGYANALKEFDVWLGRFLTTLDPDDLVILTADHGNDPTWIGTDHTREEVPVFVLHDSQCGTLGTRMSFTDVAATLADYFAIPPWPLGTSMLR